MEDRDPKVQILFGKEYLRQACRERSRLELQEIQRCQAAVRQWQGNPGNAGLNFERLGRGARQNHWSIRASEELRVILAVQLEGNRPERAAVMNMGHHDAMYKWSERQGYRTDLQNRSVVLPPDSPAMRHVDRNDPAAPPLDFEDWMLFLSPAQEQVVNKYLAGAARIRGAAGTGKTVLALHRAVVLGRRYADRRILVTTFSRSLCTHMESLYQRMPDAPENVIFRNVDALAAQVLGDQHSVDLGQVEQAFGLAYQKTVPAQLDKRVGRDYLREEVRRVIKGRDASKEEYLDTGRFERLGRIQSFRLREREVCWQLREAWDREMRRLGTDSFEDRLIAARNRVWEAPEPAYRSVIVDEGQDMTLVGVQFVRGLVAGPPEARLEPDSMLVLDDSAQRIYSGGFKPTWANLDYSSYSGSVAVNYRNSRPIFEAAKAVRGDVIVARDDNDDGAASDIEFEREGGSLPVLLRASADETAAALDRLEYLVRTGGFRHEEIAILTLHNRDAESVVERLQRRHIPGQNLKDLRKGPLGDGVRVGTFDRAKGLEFRVVFIVRVGKSRFPFDEHDPAAYRTTDLPGTEDPLSGQIRELRQLRLDRLYVAMTRARDRLIVVSDEEPCAEIERVCNSFERVVR